MLRRSLDRKGKAVGGAEAGAEDGKERPKRAAARKSPSRLQGRKAAASRKRA